MSAGIVHYQVHQDNDGNFQFRYIPDLDGPGELKTVVAKLEELLKPKSSITVESVPDAPAYSIRQIPDHSPS